MLFLGKFVVLCFLEIPVLRFALLPCYWRIIIASNLHHSLKQLPVLNSQSFRPGPEKWQLCGIKVLTVKNLGPNLPCHSTLTIFLLHSQMAWTILFTRFELEGIFEVNDGESKEKQVRLAHRLSYINILIKRLCWRIFTFHFYI